MKGGAWLARSYKRDGKTVLEVHPKGGWLKVKIGAVAAQAPRTLLPIGETRSGWISIYPRDLGAGQAFVTEALKSRL